LIITVTLFIPFISGLLRRKESMKDFCPFCEKETELSHIQAVEEIQIKGESIPVEVDYFRCTECGEEFDNPDPTYDSLALAYQEYRNRKKCE
jgi:YgiT-type zinc finger domain-containing protein